MYRLTKAQKEYVKKLNSCSVTDKCVFCKLNNKYVISSYRYFAVTENIYPYQHWDNKQVQSHYLIIPKRHIHDLEDFTHNEVLEYHAITMLYQKRGFNLYIRSTTDNTSSTVPHLHTHLISITTKEVKSLDYQKMPYRSQVVFI